MDRMLSLLSATEDKMDVTDDSDYEKVLMLMSITECDFDVAQQYLIMAHMDLTAALENYEATRDNLQHPGTDAQAATVSSGAGDSLFTPSTDNNQTSAPPPPRSSNLPYFVITSKNKSFRAVCGEASREDKWLVVFFHDEGLNSYLGQRALWHDSAMATIQPSVMCYDADTSEDDIRTVMHEYSPTEERMMPTYLVVLNPTTQHKAHEAPRKIIPSPPGFDVDLAIGSIILFIKSANPPNYRETDSDEESQTPNHLSTPAPAPVAVHREEHPATATTLGGASPAPDSTAPRVAAITSLEPFEAAERDGGITLRLQFPKGPLDVCLAQDTPVSALLGYAAHRLHQENREAYPSPPAAPFFLGGFPPRRLELPEDLTTPLGEWKAVRPKDRLLLQRHESTAVRGTSQRFPFLNIRIMKSEIYFFMLLRNASEDLSSFYVVVFILLEFQQQQQQQQQSASVLVH
eukprot:gene896-525_t